MIRFVENRIWPPVDHDKLERFIAMVRRDLPAFAFPKAYLDLLELANGGKPIDAYFRVNGESQPIDFFLNFGPTDESVDVNIRRLNVSVFWSAIFDRLSVNLVPFAVTPFGDALCFKFCDLLEEPEVVLWNHEKSSEDNPYSDFVAKDFVSFCNNLEEQNEP